MKDGKEVVGQLVQQNIKLPMIVSCWSVYKKSQVPRPIFQYEKYLHKSE